MATKKTIAIIGASGSMGSALAKSLARGNYRLLLMSGEATALASLKGDIETKYGQAEVEVIPCSVDACWEADIIILAIPYSAEKAVAEKIRQVATGKIVISIANPMNQEFTALSTEPGTSAAETLQQLLPNSRVIKAFNTTYAADFEQPVIDGKMVDAFIAGDDEESLQTVNELVATAGFNPVMAGGLQTSRTLESMQALLIQLTMKNNYNWLAGWKILHN